MPAPTESWTLTARWVVPVVGPPLEHGTITIRADSLEAVEPFGQRSADQDLGNVALLPGFVNAHTHLDLTGLRDRCPPTQDFTAWLRHVIELRRQRSSAQTMADIRLGAAECLRAGTTLVGDISAGGQSWDVLRDQPMRAVVFHELLGLSRLRAEQAVESAKSWLGRVAATTTCRPGLSPHAPYSVSDWLFGQAANLADQHRLPLTTHLGETRAEYQLLLDHSGPLREFLQGLGAWDPDGLVSFPEEVCLIYHDRSLPRVLAHANYADGTLLAVSQSSVVYCPRTHAAFGHPPHPFREFLARGIRVALGTDSLASNPDLDILAEARFIHQRYPDVPGDTLLRMLTLRGAQALGWGDEKGSLTAGKRADLVVLPLPDRDAAEPFGLILESSLAVQAVLIGGQWAVGGS